MAKVRLLVGTRKAGFIYTSDEKRQKWQQSEPILPGWSIYHMAADLRADTPRFYAAANHWAWGPSVARSTDGGNEWDVRSPKLGFPKDMSVSMESVWEVRPGHQSEPGVVYAGTQPAGLFRSEDWGAHGRRSILSTGISTGSTGAAPAATRRACTRSRSIRAIRSTCTSLSAPAALTSRATVARPGSSARIAPSQSPRRASRSMTR